MLLNFLLHDHPSDEGEPALASTGIHESGDWWNFERRSQWDPTHPAAAWATHLLQEAASIRLPCPRCGREAVVGVTLDHMLRHHRAGYAEAAAWLEEADPDLFSLAVHYLATKARASRGPCDSIDVREQRRPAVACSSAGPAHPDPRALLPGWCRRSVPASRPVPGRGAAGPARTEADDDSRLRSGTMTPPSHGSPV